VENRLIVDVIIPVHDAGRAVDRAVASIVDDPVFDSTSVRVTVICHNIPRGQIVQRLGERLTSRVRLLEVDDGFPSPAGPFTMGIERATAEFVSIMGSDDWLEPGALAAWIAAARGRRADVVIAPQRHQAGGRVRTPPTRPCRRRPLDAYRDRLIYRTAPLGLVRLESIRRLGLRFPAHLKNGSDQLFTLQLWHSDCVVVYPHGTPSYVVGADAPSRVTTAPRPAAEELRAVAELVREPAFDQLDLRARRAVVVKLVRIHISSGALVRTRADRWTVEDRATFRTMLADFEAVAPRYRSLLSRADDRLVSALLQGNAPVSQLAELLDRRARYGSPETLLPTDLGALLAVHGPLRFLLASRML